MTHTHPAERRSAHAEPTPGASYRPKRGSVKPVGTLRQILVFTRFEMVLFYRYRLALFFAVFPLAFVVLGLAQSGREVAPGVDSGAHYIASSLALAPMILAILHVTNIITSRREQMVLKRLRVGGAPATAIFGAVTLSVVLASLVLSCVGLALLVGSFGVAPVQPVLVAVPVVLSATAISVFSMAYSRLCRNAEGAQLMSMIPFMVFYGASGLMVPLSVLPDGFANAMRLFPIAPAAEIATSAYFGRDFFWGAAGEHSLVGVDLWVGALPSVAVLVAWILLSMFFLRYFRWDPREAG